MIIGWLLSIPLTVALGSRLVGRRFAKWGLLQVASERQAEPILVRHQHWIDQLALARRDCTTECWFERVIEDSAFRNQHLEILEAAASQQAVQEHEPEWSQRWLPVHNAADVPPAARRRLLCDDGWLKSLPENLPS